MLFALKNPRNSIFLLLFLSPRWQVVRDLISRYFLIKLITYPPQFLIGTLQTIHPSFSLSCLNKQKKTWWNWSWAWWYRLWACKKEKIYTFTHSSINQLEEQWARDRFFSRLKCLLEKEQKLHSTTTPRASSWFADAKITTSVCTEDHELMRMSCI